MDLDSVGKFLINDPNVSHLPIVEGYHPMSPKKNGLNEKREASFNIVGNLFNAITMHQKLREFIRIHTSNKQ
jgi:hypothetical protein